MCVAFSLHDHSAFPRRPRGPFLTLDRRRDCLRWIEAFFLANPDRLTYVAVGLPGDAIYPGYRRCVALAACRDDMSPRSVVRVFAVNVGDATCKALAVDRGEDIAAAFFCELVAMNEKQPLWCGQIMLQGQVH